MPTVAPSTVSNTRSQPGCRAGNNHAKYQQYAGNEDDAATIGQGVESFGDFCLEPDINA